MREQGPAITWRYFKRKAGIRWELYYRVRELMPREIPEKLRVLPEGYSFGSLGDADFEKVGLLQDNGENASVEMMRDRARQGHTCLGIRKGSEVVAFTWFALDRTQTVVYRKEMLPNEAYLFNAYVVPEERGRNLAVIMRYRSYEILREKGRDTLYSVTLRENKASWRFKEKLGAEKVFLALYGSLFHKLEFRWILRRYPLARA